MHPVDGWELDGKNGANFSHRHCRHCRHWVNYWDLSNKTCWIIVEILDYDGSVGWTSKFLGNYWVYMIWYHAGGYQVIHTRIYRDNSHVVIPNKKYQKNGDSGEESTWRISNWCMGYQAMIFLRPSQKKIGKRRQDVKMMMFSPHFPGFQTFSTTIWELLSMEYPLSRGTCKP